MMPEVRVPSTVGTCGGAMIDGVGRAGAKGSRHGAALGHSVRRRWRWCSQRLLRPTFAFSRALCSHLFFAFSLAFELGLAREHLGVDDALLFLLQLLPLLLADAPRVLDRIVERIAKWTRHLLLTVGLLELQVALGTDGLLAAFRPVQSSRIPQEAYRALVKIRASVLPPRVARRHLLLLNEFLDSFVVPLARRVQAGRFRELAVAPSSPHFRQLVAHRASRRQTAGPRAGKPANAAAPLFGPSVLHSQPGIAMPCLLLDREREKKWARGRNKPRVEDSARCNVPDSGRDAAQPCV